MSERNCKRYFAQGNYGQDLFYIELVDVGFPEYFLSSSLPANIFEHADIIRLHAIIVNKKTSEATRIHFIKKLFTAIKAFPDISKYYFDICILDKYGKYSKILDSTYQSLIQNYKLQTLVPYSPHRNQAMFHEIEKAFIADKDDNLRVQAEKELFEENLINDNLKFSYVEVYSTEAIYYFQQEKVDDTLIEFYFMTVDGKLLFLFLIPPYEP